MCTQLSTVHAAVNDSKCNLKQQIMMVESAISASARSCPTGVWALLCTPSTKNDGNWCKTVHTSPRNSKKSMATNDSIRGAPSNAWTTRDYRHLPRGQATSLTGATVPVRWMVSKSNHEIPWFCHGFYQPQSQRTSRNTYQHLFNHAQND